MAKPFKWPWQRSRDAPVRDESRRGGWSEYDHLSLLPNIRQSIEAGGQGMSADVIYAAVTRIAGALSAMPVRLYRGYEEARESPLYWLLYMRPNRRMSASVFRRALMGWVLTEGRGYAVRRLDDAGRTVELEIVDPRWVTPMQEQKSGELWFAILPPDKPVEYIHSAYVLAFQHMTLDGITAQRPIDVLRGAVAYQDDVRMFSLESVKGVNRSIVLEYPTTLSGQNRQRSVAEFFELYKQSGGQIIALDSGVKAARLDSSPIDAKLVDIEKLTRSRVATVYNLPPHLLGDYSDATAASIEQQTLEFLTLTMQPIVQQWEDELDWKLLEPEQREQGWHFRIDMDAYIRADSAATASRDQAAIRTGKRTVNEIRTRDYMPPVEGGDVAMVSKDLAPVELVAKGATIDVNQINGENNAAQGSE